MSKEDHYEAMAFTTSEIARAINTLAETFNEMEFTQGTRGMAFIMMFIVFQHRLAGHNMDMLIAQLKSVWSMLDQLDQGKSDKDLSKDN